MRQLVVTGMATEHDFASQSEQYLLVLSNGLRIPVSEEVAQEVIKSLFGNGEPQETEEVETTARPKPPESRGAVMAPVGSTYSDSDDGVESV